MAIIKNISRLSELKIFSKIVSGMKTILAHEKKSYSVDIEKIQGTKIASITQQVATESGGRNAINIKFEDGTLYPLYVYNGTQGKQGKTGDDGEKGNKGDSASVRAAQKLYIANDNVTDKAVILDSDDNPIEGYGWSALRGHEMYNAIRGMYETFTSEDEYNLLWNNIVWMEAHFTTDNDEQTTVLFNNDTNDHTAYVKYWTYEDSTLATYYVAIYDDNEQLVRYDTVTADLWKDIYLGATSGYFVSTNNQLSDGSKVYFYDASKNVYVETVNVKRTVIDPETQQETQVFIGDRVFDYYSPELDTYVHVEYDATAKKYDYALLAKELEITIYEKTSATEFKRVDDLSSIDTTGTVNYYFAKNDDSLITNIDEYLSKKPIRYFLKGDENVETHTHGETTVNSKYTEVDYNKDANGNNIYDTLPSEINTSQFVEYIVLEYDKMSNTYTMTRFYKKTLYGEDYYASQTVVFTNGTITLYSNMPKREYYTAELVENPTTHVFENVYTKIDIPVWVYAEFVTTEEDQKTLLLSQNKEEGIDESTIEQDIDTTKEDTEEDLDDNSVQITHILAGAKETIYTKDSHNKYVVVDLDVDVIDTVNGVYYTKDAALSYDEITGQDAIDYYANGNALYTLANGVYTVYRGTVNLNDTYYYGYETYTRITDIDAYLHTTNVTLFSGEPYKIPITVYPTTATNRKMEIEYDSTKVTLYEDGRIAAIEQNGTTEIVLTAVDGSNVKCTLNILVTMPMKAIMLKDSDGENANTIVNKEINKGESFTIYGSYLPADTSDTTIVFTSEDSTIATVVAGDNIANVTGTNVGITTINADAHDGYIAKSEVAVEVIQPASELAWNQNDIEHYTKAATYYDEFSAAAANAQHENDPDWTPVSDGDIMTPAIDEYRMVVLVNQEYELSPVFTPEDTTYQELTWISEDRNIKVTLEERKVIDSPEISHNATAEEAAASDGTISEGETIIDSAEEFHYENYYALKAEAATNGFVKLTGTYTRGSYVEIELYVRADQAITEITINPGALSFNVATKKMLNAVITPDDAVNATYKWRILDKNIITMPNENVDEDGDVITTKTAGTGNLIIRGEMPGITKVQALAADGSGVVGECDVTVTVPITGISISGANNEDIIYVGIGANTNLTALVTYSSTYATDSTLPKLNVVWNSSNEDVATVDQDGKVTGVEVGDATIMAYAADGSGVLGSVKVYVIKLTESIAFEETEITMDVNESYALVPTFTPDDTSNEIVIWTSSNTDVATVNDGGIVTAIAPGEVTITAATTDGTGKRAQCTVKIA